MYITENESFTLVHFQLGLNERMIEFIKSLKTGEKFTRENYEGYFTGKISEKTARNDISDLESGGWVKKSGKGPSTKYIRTNKEIPENTG